MKRSFLLGVFILLFVGQTNLWGVEKQKFATSVKEYPIYYLPILAADEKGIWKQNGLEVEWVPMSGDLMYRALATRAIEIGFGGVPATFRTVAGGVPAVIVMGLYPADPFYIWVRSDSRFRQPVDLKGAKIGVSNFGGSQHNYGLAAVKGLGLDKEVKFIAVGGIAETVAAVKAGSTDALVMPLAITIELKARGELRELVNTFDYLPKEWADMVLIAHKGFVKEKPDQVKRVVKSIFQSIDFIEKNGQWSIDKMKAVQGFSDQAARLLYQSFQYKKDGKISAKGLENVRKFMIDYGQIARDKAPPVEAVYTTEFTG